MSYSSLMNTNTDNFSHCFENKIFLDNHLQFINNGWQLKENTKNNIVYSHPIYPTDEFKVNINNKLIKVTIPVLGANYAYSTTFNSYYQASEYLQLHFNYYMEKVNY